MKALYPILGRITWYFGKRAAKEKLPNAPSRNKVAVGVTTAALTVAAVAALRRRNSDRLI